MRPSVAQQWVDPSRADRAHDLLHVGVKTNELAMWAAKLH